VPTSTPRVPRRSGPPHHSWCCRPPRALRQGVVSFGGRIPTSTGSPTPRCPRRWSTHGTAREGREGRGGQHRVHRCGRDAVDPLPRPLGHRDLRAALQTARRRCGDEGRQEHADPPRCGQGRHRGTRRAAGRPDRPDLLQRGPGRPGQGPARLRQGPPGPHRPRWLPRRRGARRGRRDQAGRPREPGRVAREARRPDVRGSGEHGATAQRAAREAGAAHAGPARGRRRPRRSRGCCGGARRRRCCGGARGRRCCGGARAEAAAEEPAAEAAAEEPEAAPEADAEESAAEAAEDEPTAKSDDSA
jgi:hypothetical protein